jgi:hypothetical protein
VDVVLHCGDFTTIGSPSAHRKALRLLGNIDAQIKIVIAGDHDIGLDRELQGNYEDLKVHQKAVDLMISREATDAGVLYLTEGVHPITLRNGTTFTICVSPFTPRPSGGGAFKYERTGDRWQNIPEDIEILMTHGPPKGFLDVSRSDEDYGENVGCGYLRKAVERTRPLMHCFGHVHGRCGTVMQHWVTMDNPMNKIATVGQVNAVGRSLQSFLPIEYGKATLFVNASVMDESHRPTQAPWLIELPLGRSE